MVFGVVNAVVVDKGVIKDGGTIDQSDWIHIDKSTLPHHVALFETGQPVEIEVFGIGVSVYFESKVFFYYVVSVFYHWVDFVNDSLGQLLNFAVAIYLHNVHL